MHQLYDIREKDLDSQEITELIRQYGVVSKQLSQMEQEKGLMLVIANGYRNDQAIKNKVDTKYGEGASDFFANAIEAYYNIEN